MENVVDLKAGAKSPAKTGSRATALAGDARFYLQEATRSLIQLDALLWMVTKHATDEREPSDDVTRERIARAAGACQELAKRAGTHTLAVQQALYGKDAVARIFEPY